MKIALSMPGFGKVDSNLPVPTGGLFTIDKNGNVISDTGMNAIQALIVLVVTLAIFLALWYIGKGGLDIIQSRGVKEKFKEGRERVLYAVFGLIMIFISFVMMSIISAFFGVDILPFLKFK